MKASKENPRVGWYLEPPFNDPHHAGFFRCQNWWNEEPCLCVDDKTGSVTRKPVPKEAAAYELARRHPQVGLMLLGRKLPGSGVELFLFDHAREAWPWLPAESRESWRELVPPHKSRTDERLEIISTFEGTEQGRVFQFNQPAKENFEKWVSSKRRKTIEPRKANQPERRAFELVCNRAYLSLNAR